MKILGRFNPFLIAVIAFTRPLWIGVHAETVQVENVIPVIAGYELQDVRLLDGPFKHAQELDRQYLLSLEPDRLLHTFRLNAGLPSSAEPLGGWERPDCELRGHFAGHYLTACAMMFASTGDEELKSRAEALVRGLAECQAQLGSGYLSAFPEEFFDRVEKSERVWAPYYTLHKLYAGLLDMYVYCGDNLALEVCKKFADWVIARNARLTDAEMQRMLDAEHGGMNEVLANLYAVTGERKYLDISLRFNHMAVIRPAANEVDQLTGLHANTQIPKFVGVARQYELTGDPALKTAAEFFWDTVANERSYVIGGNSDSEHFSPKETLSNALGPATTETCNTYNMLKLTRHLFSWHGDAGHADFYERGLYNHILASQHPETGMMCYYVPLRSGSSKGGRNYGYNSPMDSFWCCTGTGIENHARYGRNIYFHDDRDTLYVNLFIASELRIPETGIVLRQETRFPEEDATRLFLSCPEPTQGTLKIRCPGWVEGGARVLLNGRELKLAAVPGSYMSITRTWQDGDCVEATFPFTLRTEAFSDNPDRFAFLYGPLVLSAEVERGGPFPAVVGSREEAVASLQAAGPRANMFISAPGVFQLPGNDRPVRLRFEPFYQVHGERPYAVYWDRFTPAEWQRREEAYLEEQARLKMLEERTIDVVHPGEQQSETDHSLQGENTNSGDFSGRKYRHAMDGWFSYDLKVLSDEPQELWVTYWGSDGGGRVFDVLIDGVKLVTQRLEQKQPDRFYDEVTRIPLEMTRGKKSITVRFQAHPGNYAGGVFGLRVVKAAEPAQG